MTDTKEIYVTTTGLEEMKSELENLCLKYLKPEIYKEIEEEYSEEFGKPLSIYDVYTEEDIYYIREYHLCADKGMKVTKDGKNFFNEITIPEADLDEWSEVVWTK